MEPRLHHPPPPETTMPGAPDGPRPLSNPSSNQQQQQQQQQRLLRAALGGACRRLPNNPEAHFHLGLMHMRSANGEEALRAFQKAKRIYEDREQRCRNHHPAPAAAHGRRGDVAHAHAHVDADHGGAGAVPPRLAIAIAKLRAHTAQAAHLAAATRLSREERAPLLDRLQRDLVASTQLDSAQPDVWNALALLHLTEGGYAGARDVLRSIHEAFPDYLDALNNLGLAELALGNEEGATACFQQVIMADHNNHHHNHHHPEALSNYGILLLRSGMFDSAAKMFERAVVDHSDPLGLGLAPAWGGLAVARAAMGQLAQAEEAAAVAERLGDLNSRVKFSMLLASIRARRLAAELRSSVAAASPDGRELSAVRSAASNTPPPRGPAKRSRSFDGSAADESRTPQSRCPEEHPADHLPETKHGHSLVPEDLGSRMDATVTRLRSIARELGSASSSTALGAILRLRHDYSFDETGGRNLGAEAAERLVEALEFDETDSSAWVQLALLQMGIGEYDSARDFSAQAVSRCRCLEAGWNTLGVSYQLVDDLGDADRAYERALLSIVTNYSRKRNELGKMSEAGGHGEPTLSRGDWECVSDGDGDGPHKTSSGALSLGRLGDCETLGSETTPMPTESSISGEDLAMRDPLGSFPIYQLSDYREQDLNKAGLVALATVYNNIGNLRRQQGASFAEALTAYEKSLRLGGESAAVYNNLALLYISVGRVEDAEKMLSHALTIDPFFDCAVSNLLKLRSLAPPIAATT